MDTDPLRNINLVYLATSFPVYKVYLYIGLIVFFILMCGFYSSTETAFACLNKFEYKVKADEGDKKAKLIVKLYDHFDTTLISVLIGNNVFAILISIFSTTLFLAFFNGAIDEYYISLIASILMAILTFFFGDTVPKFLGKKIPEVIVRINAYPMAFFVILFSPISFILWLLINIVRKVFRVKDEPLFSEEDLLLSIEEKEEKGELEENESDIIAATLEFADTKVKEVLTPVRKMKMLDVSHMNNKTLIEFLKVCPYSRIPLYKDNKNNVIGILMVKDFLAAYFKNPSVNYMLFVKKPYIVKPSIKMDDLLEGFKKEHVQIAIVKKNEVLLGMVTMEDVLEELVGNMSETELEIAEGKR